MRKKHVVLLVVGAVCAIGAAGTVYMTRHPSALTVEDVAHCEDESQTASDTMLFRQKGESMASLIKWADEEENPDTRRFQRKYVSRAFEEPRWTTPAAINEAIAEVKNEAYLECLKNLKR